MACVKGQETTKVSWTETTKEKTLPVVSRSSNCLRLSHAIVENNYLYKFLQLHPQRRKDAKNREESRRKDDVERKGNRDRDTKVV